MLTMTKLIGKKHIREQVRAKFGNKCAYCGNELKELHIDHVEPLRRHLAVGSINYPKGENHIDNFFPCCKSCNSSKGDKNIEGFRQQLQDRHNFMMRYSSEYRSMIKFNIISVNNNPVKFYFETL